MLTSASRSSMWSSWTRSAARAMTLLGCLAPAAVGAVAQPPPLQAVPVQVRDSILPAAARAIAHGKTAEAESLGRARGADDPEGAAVLARLLVSRGRYDEAATLLRAPAAADPASEAALELGLLLTERGSKVEARRVLATVSAAATRSRSAVVLLRSARAARALGQTRTANALFRDATTAAPNDPAIDAAWGELLLEKFNLAEAARSFRVVLERDAEWAPAHLGLARAVAAEDPQAAAASARRALQIDSTLVDAHLFVAESALDDDHPAEAREAIQRALATNPHSLEAHALAGAQAYVEGRTADFDAEVAQTLAVNPVYGDAYRIAANRAARSYRFDEAVSLAWKAVTLEPDNVRASAALGMHQMRAGDERGARTALERAFRDDPYDLVTYNLLQLLDSLDTFDSFAVGDAVVRLHPAESPVLKYYAVPIVEQALASMGARYKLKPRGPILVEVFPKHDDFAVRTLGLPGLLGALGACFGRVVTLDSPRARPPGTFNWQATLWHEVAHVFSLQLSNQRVPRWLTEGISVYEEGRVRPEWARDAELGFARAFAEGKVPKLADLNAGFNRPDMVSLSYFQSSLVVGLIVETYGDEALNTMLQAYGEGLDTNAALRKATGTDLPALQVAFDTRLDKRYATLGKALKVPAGVNIPQTGDTVALQALAATYRDSYPVQMAAGLAFAAAAMREAAFGAFERAAVLVPRAAGPASPHAQMALLADRAGDRVRAIREWRALVAEDHDNVEAARRLADLAEKAGNQEARALAYERIVTVDPFDAKAHTAFGRMALERRDHAVAIREFQAALAAGPSDAVSSRCDVAEALLQADRIADAKREVLTALDAALTYERAQALLLRIIEKETSAS